jgi:hypothetical protein
MKVVRWSNSMNKENDHNSSQSEANSDSEDKKGCFWGFIYNFGLVFLFGGAVYKILNLRLRMDMRLWTLITIVLILLNMWWFKFRYKNKRRTFAQGWYIGMALILLIFGFLIFFKNCNFMPLG